MFSIELVSGFVTHYSRITYSVLTNTLESDPSLLDPPLDLNLYCHRPFLVPEDSEMMVAISTVQIKERTVDLGNRE